jgi:hypothetical protein
MAIAYPLGQLAASLAGCTFRFNFHGSAHDGLMAADACTFPVFWRCHRSSYDWVLWLWKKLGRMADLDKGRLAGAEARLILIALLARLKPRLLARLETIPQRLKPS